MFGGSNADELARTFTNGQGAGTVVVTAVGDITKMGIPISAGKLMLFQKRLQGVLFGGCSPSVDIPRQLEMYRSGMLKLDKLVTRTYTLDEVAQGFSDLHAGVNIREIVLSD
jgi:Zn-dependent alcohol dehydrogenase